MPELTTFHSLIYPAFRIYLVGMLGQMAARNMQLITLSMLIYRITGSAKAIGLVALAGILAHIFSSLYGGVVADRMEKKMC